jgi:hypothetical protein
MLIISDIKSFITNPNEFVKTKANLLLYYSSVLKIAAFVAIYFNTILPTYLIAASVVTFIASFYCDYKIMTNLENLFFVFARKNIKNNSQNSFSHFIGRLVALSVKSNLIDSIKGFYKGFKEEFCTKI